jgi:hypothetical protein
MDLPYYTANIGDCPPPGVVSPSETVASTFMAVVRGHIPMVFVCQYSRMPIFRYSPLLSALQLFPEGEANCIGVDVVIFAVSACLDFRIFRMIRDP